MKGITKEKFYHMKILAILLLEKRFCKTLFQVGKDMKKVQKQGRGEERKKTTLHLPKILSRCRLAFFPSSI